MKKPDARAMEQDDYAIAQQARCIRVSIAIDLAKTEDEGEFLRSTATHTELRSPDFPEDFAEAEIRQWAGDVAVAAWLKARGELTVMRKAALGLVEEQVQ